MLGNPYLPLLVSRYATFGADAGPIQVRARQTTAAAGQPPRLYMLFSKGGGIFRDEAMAQAMAKGGYTVLKFRPDKAEGAYLRAMGVDPTVPLWTISCDGIAMKDEQGRPVCKAPAGLKRIKESEAQTLGLVTKSDYDAAFQYVPPDAVAGYHYYVATAKPTGAELAAAVRMAHQWDDIARRVARMQQVISISQITFSSKVTLPLVRAQVFLAETAQPVSLLKKDNPTAFPGQGSQVSESFGVTPVHVGVAVVVVAIVLAGAAVYCASKAEETAKIQQEVTEGYTEMEKELVACITSPETTTTQRFFCRQALGDITAAQPKAPPNSTDQIVQILKYAVPLVAIGAAAVYLGPAVLAASKGFATGVESWRETRQIA